MSLAQSLSCPLLIISTRFGGTDGNKWFNDVWIYDPRTNIWAQQDCIGYIPVPREGHSAALVNDVMYVLGGRTEEGKDLGDLAAFRITTRRWYTFQNMGPSPSPRSGHGMTAYGNKLIVVGGEPSTTPRDPSELSLAYILDTTKIKYPLDTPGTRSHTSRRPSVTDRAQTPSQERSASRQGVRPEPREAGNGRARRQGSQESLNSASQYQSPLDPANDSSARNGTVTAGQLSGVGPPPFQSNVPTNKISIEKSGSVRSATSQDDYARRFAPDLKNDPVSPIARVSSPFQSRGPNQLGQYTPQQSFDEGPRELPGSSAVYRQPPTGHGAQSSLDSVASSMVSVPAPNGIARQAVQNNIHARQNNYQDPGDAYAAGQRHDDLMKELETVRSKNAWYASELALARKSGYRPTSSDGPPGERGGEAFAENEKPLVEALLKMRAELSKVQDALTTQSNTAAEKIAQVQKERDAAIQEAVYAKTRIAARGNKFRDSIRNTPTPDADRSEDVNRRFASTLAAHKELLQRMQVLSAELEAEKRARQMAQESADAAHNRAQELDSHKQETVSELERLRKELHETQSVARQTASEHTQATGDMELLVIDKGELAAKLESAQETARNHTNVLASLHDAIKFSTEKATQMESRLEEERRKVQDERQQRATLEDQLAQLRTEHSLRQSELERTTSRASELESEVAHHKEEARTHREAVLTGLGRLTQNDAHNVKANDERVIVLQQHLQNTRAVMQHNQDAADRAAEKLRAAEERIAGLEAFQEQSSRDGLNVRKQLQIASREALSLKTENANLQQQLTAHKLNVTTLQVQHGALKGLLSDRGVDGSDISNRSGHDTAVNGTTNSGRLADLEAQLATTTRAHEEMRSSFERREMEANRGWEEKLATLDNDYQSAVKYLKGTEKMLSKMKQELQRYKTQNRELEDEVTRARSGTPTAGSATEANSSATTRQPENEWEAERNHLRAEIERLQHSVTSSRTQLESQISSINAAQSERDTHKTASESLQRQLATHRNDVEALRTQNNTLEARAAEAERKIQLLLDTVGSTVNNYRRNSQSAEGMLSGNFDHQPHNTGHNRDFSVASLGADSMYGGGPGEAIPPSAAGEQHDRSVPVGMQAPHTGVSHHARNSLALDNLASELETLRTHWETTAKEHRLSDRSVDLGRSMQDHPGNPDHDQQHNHEEDSSSTAGPSVRHGPTGPDPSPIAAAVHEARLLQQHEIGDVPPSPRKGMQDPASWRRKLDLGDDGEGSTRGHSAQTSTASAAASAAPERGRGFGKVDGASRLQGQEEGQDTLPQGYVIGQGQMPYASAQHLQRPQLSGSRGQSSNASEPSGEMDIA